MVALQNICNSRSQLLLDFIFERCAAGSPAQLYILGPHSCKRRDGVAQRLSGVLACKTHIGPCRRRCSGGRARSQSDAGLRPSSPSQCRLIGGCHGCARFVIRARRSTRAHAFGRPTRWLSPIGLGSTDRSPAQRSNCRRRNRWAGSVSGTGVAVLFFANPRLGLSRLPCRDRCRPIACSGHSRARAPVNRSIRKTLAQGFPSSSMARGADRRKLIGV